MPHLAGMSMYKTLLEIAHIPSASCCFGLTRPSGEKSSSLYSLSHAVIRALVDILQGCRGLGQVLVPVRAAQPGHLCRARQTHIQGHFSSFRAIVLVNLRSLFFSPEMDAVWDS